MCNHFIKSKLRDGYTVKDSKDELIEFAKRFGARICKEGNTWVDLEIPVFLDSNDLSKISYILIQVKCWSVASLPQQWESINPVRLGYEGPIRDEKSRKALPFFLTIWMQLGKCKRDSCNKVSTFFVLCIVKETCNFYCI